MPKMIVSIKDFINPVHGWLEERGCSVAVPVYVSSEWSDWKGSLLDAYTASGKRRLDVKDYNRTWRVWNEYPSELDMQTLWMVADPDQIERKYTRREVNMLMECVFDAAWNAMSLKMRGDIEWDDSRDVFEAISSIAWKYEADHNFHADDEDQNYLEEIDEVSIKTLKNLFAREE